MRSRAGVSLAQQGEYLLFAGLLPGEPQEAEAEVSSGGLPTSRAAVTHVLLEALRVARAERLGDGRKRAGQSLACAASAVRGSLARKTPGHDDGGASVARSLRSWVSSVLSGVSAQGAQRGHPGAQRAARSGGGVTGEAQRTYTEDEIRAAFWVEFHEAGELWYGNLGPPAENTADTERYWLEFLKALREGV